MVCIGRYAHPHRPTQTSVPTDADIRTDRRRHPHRPTQTSAPTDTDIRTDRYRHPHRPIQTSAPTDADYFSTMLSMYLHTMLMPFRLSPPSGMMTCAKRFVGSMNCSCIGLSTFR